MSGNRRAAVRFAFAVCRVRRSLPSSLTFFSCCLLIENQANLRKQPRICGTSPCYFIYLLPLLLLLPYPHPHPHPHPVPCFLYLLSDGPSSVRWMCAFPGQMALLLLAVPGSHFNTLATLPGERAPLLQGAANVCVVRRTAWVLTLFVCVCCQGLDFQHRLCAKKTDGLFPK